MVEFLRKSESRGDKIARVLLNSHHQIYQFTLILYGVSVHCDGGRLSVLSPFIEKSMAHIISKNEYFLYIVCWKDES